MSFLLLLLLTITLSQDPVVDGGVVNTEVLHVLDVPCLARPKVDSLLHLLLHSSLVIEVAIAVGVGKKHFLYIKQQVCVQVERG